MSFNLGTAIGYLDLDTSKFKNGFKSALGDLEAFSKSSATASSKLTSLGSACSSVGSSLTKNVTLPLVGIGTATVATAAKFETAMSEVKAISGATGEDFEALTAKAQEMGAKTKFSASESAAALKYMAMAGWDTEAMLNGINGVMQLAAASGEDLATTSDIVTDAMTAFGMSADQSTRFADVLAQTANKSNTSVALMGETFKYVAPVAGALGYSIEDASVAIGLMANSGIKGSQAGTSLKNMLTNLAKPTDQVKGYMDALNISMVDQAGNVKPLNQLLLEMRDSFSQLTDAEKAEYAAGLAGKQGMSGLLAIVNSSDEDFNKLTQAINESNGAAQRVADTMQDNLGGQLTIIKSTLEGIAISFGNILLPAVKKVASWLQELLNKINNLTDAQKKTIVTIAGVVADIGPALLIVGKLLTSIGKLPSALAAAKNGLTVVKGALTSVGSSAGWIIAIVAALVAGFILLWKNNEDFRNNVMAIWDQLKGSFAELGNSIGAIINQLMPVLSTLATTLMEAFAGIAEAIIPVLLEVISSVLTIIIDLLSQILPVLLKIIQAVLPVLVQFIQRLLPILVQIVEAVLPVLMELIQALLPVITQIIEAVLPVLIQLIDALLPVVMKIIEAVLPVILDLIETLVPVIMKIIEAVLPALIQLINTLTPIIMKIIQAVLPVLIQLIEAIVPVLLQIIEAIFPVLIQLINTIVPVIMQIIDAVLPVLIEILNLLTPILDLVISLLTPILDLIVSLVGPILELVLSAITPLIEIFTTLISAVLEPLGPILQVVAEIFTSVLGGAIKSISPIIQALTGIFKGLIDFITGVFSGDWSKAWNGIVEVFGGLWDGLVAIVKAPINGVISLINGAINALNKVSVKIPDWVPGFGGQTFGINLKTIPLLAEGAVLPANNPFLAIVGDQKHGTNVEAPLSTIQEAVAVVIRSFVPAILYWQEASVTLLGYILYAAQSIHLLREDLKEIQAQGISSGDLDFGSLRKDSLNLDYDQIAQRLERALKQSPVQANVAVMMEDGDVYLDKERVGRTVAPVVSRVLTQSR